MPHTVNFCNSDVTNLTCRCKMVFIVLPTVALCSRAATLMGAIYSRKTTMNKLSLVGVSTAMLVGVSSMAPIPAYAEEGGCLKYGTVGAVGGHIAGHHAVLGAVGGCATGMWVRHKARQQERILANEGLAARQAKAAQANQGAQESRAVPENSSNNY